MMKKSPVTLVSETGERRTFDSGKAACVFLGIKSQSVLTEMKRYINKTVMAEGHKWHVAEGKVEKPMSSSTRRIKRDNGIIAIRNLGSTDPNHPEETLNFSSINQAARHFGQTTGWVMGRFKNKQQQPDEWYFRKVEDKAVRSLLYAIEEDDGVINLDEADELW